MDWTVASSPKAGPRSRLVPGSLLAHAWLGRRILVAGGPGLTATGHFDALAGVGCAIVTVRR